MSTASTVPMESKSAKKRKAKVEAAAVTALSPAGRDSPAPESVNGHAAESFNGTESSYLKELAKNIRNLHKKLAGSAKADSVVEQNPGISLDDLVTQKKLNNDQKNQLQKKPQLQAQLAQLEDQHKHYMQFAQDLQEKHDKEKAALMESHSAELEQARQEAADAAAAAAADAASAASVTAAPSTEDIEKGLAVITGFLHAAAAKRQSDDQESEEARAFEGALLLVYQGNAQSLNTLKSLVEGTDEKVIDVESNTLDYTFAQIKEVALKDAVALVEDVETSTTVADESPESTPETTSDPTITNAGLTELEDTNTVPIVSNGDVEPETVAPEQTNAGEEASNAVAEATWDPQASVTSAQTATGEDWVQVPRDLAETETPHAAPAVQQSTSNWADESAAEETTVVAENDGFEQVKRERGRGRGGYRGGRGFDGRGRGRGRGEFRGGRGQSRGGRGGTRGDRPPPPLK